MYNLSELVKTDCCIDCGTNDKLREVVGKIGIPPARVQVRYGVYDNETEIVIIDCKYSTTQSTDFNTIPLTSINIDL